MNEIQHRTGCKFNSRFLLSSVLLFVVLLIYLGGQWLQFVSEGWVLVRAISYKAKKSFALYKMRNFKL